jgi:hypothetical protein
VSIYLKLRDRFVNTILLESSDYHGNENSFSYICCQPIARFELNGDTLLQQLPDGRETKNTVTRHRDVVEALTRSAGSSRPTTTSSRSSQRVVRLHGLRRRAAFRRHPAAPPRDGENRIPEIIYQVFKYVIAINHFKDDLYVFEHRYDGEPADGRDGLTYLVSLIQNKNFPSYQFQTRGTESSNMTDEAFLEVLASGQKHCKLGDVFQIVLSRRFAQSFTGDEFNVYRALRSVNPRRTCSTSTSVRSKSSVLRPRRRSRSKAGGDHLPDCRHLPPHGQRPGRRPTGPGTLRRPQGERRTRDAGGPGPQRPEPQRHRVSGGDVQGNPVLLPRDPPGVEGDRPHG